MWDHGIPTNVASPWGGKLHARAVFFFQSQHNWRKVLNKIRQTENRFAYANGKLEIDSASVTRISCNKSGDFHSKS